MTSNSKTAKSLPATVGAAQADVKTRHAQIQKGVYLVRFAVLKDLADEVLAAGVKVIKAKGLDEEFRAYVAAKQRARRERGK